MGMSVVATLARTAALAADDDAYLDDVATREASRSS